VSWPFIIVTVISIVALGVSIKAWQKSRAIYAIESRVIRQPSGEARDEYLETNAAALNRELSSGRYTVLGLMERKGDGDWQLFLGKIKQDPSQAASRALWQRINRSRRTS
jgi:nitrogen fixation/metabolism regulation signal transduction histidine kinase